MGLPANRQPISERMPRNLPSSKLQQVERLFSKNDLVSIYPTTAEYSITPSPVHKTIHKQLTMQYHKKKVIFQGFIPERK